MFKSLIFALLFSINVSPTYATNSYEVGHCPVGPFGTDGDLGHNEHLCQQLTPQEICTTYLDAIDDNHLTDIDYAKVNFCTNIILD